MKRVLFSVLFLLFVTILFPTPSFALSSCAKTFQDLVNTDAQYIPAIGCLNQQYCVVQGTAEGYLLASTPITRAEAVALVARYHVEVLKDWTYVTPGTPSFTDVPKSYVLYKEIETAKARGFILGNATGTFDPNGRWVYGYQGPNRSDYNFSLQPADQQNRGGFLKSMYDIGKTRNQLSACVATYCDEATARLSRPRGLCSNNAGCMRANPYYSSTPDCNSPIQQPTYVNDPSCGPVAGADNSACPVTPPTATPTPVPPTATPTPLPSDGTTCSDINGNGYVKLAYTAPNNGTYTVWTRMKAGSAATDGYFLQIGNQCNVLVGGGGVSNSQWQWVNYRDGNTGSKITVNLEKGAAYTIHLAGKESNVKVDKLLLTLDPNCIPNEMGDNCNVPPTATPIPPTNTPIPPTPTFTPTPTIIAPTISPTPTFTPTPSPIVTITPTFTPVPNSTVLNFTVILHAIGLGGDNTNPTSTGNFSPLTTTRPMTIEIYNASNQLLKTVQTTIGKEMETTAPPTDTDNGLRFTGRFIGAISIPANELPSGTYILRVKVPNYLVGRITTGVTTGEVNAVPLLTLVVGDTDQDNRLSILDYNKLLKCYSDILQNNNCTEQEKKETDLNDDGKINFIDLQYFIRELATQRGG